MLVCTSQQLKHMYTHSQVCADSDAAQKRVQQLEGDFIRAQQKVGNSNVQVNEFEQRAVAMLNSFEPLPTPRGRLAAFTLKHLSSYSSKNKTPSASNMMAGGGDESGMAGEPNHEQIKEQLRDIFGEQAHRLRNALIGHNTFSTEVKKVVQGIKDKSLELASKSDEYAAVPGFVHHAKASKLGGTIFLAKEKGKRKKVYEPTAACTVVDMIDGWKEARPSNGTLQPFWYNSRTRTVAFSPPLERTSYPHTARQVEEYQVEAGAADLNTATDCDILTQTEATQSLASGLLRDKMRNDSITCNGEQIPARRATFGRHISISGRAVIAEPFLADSELTNAASIRGNIAVIGRGVTQFTEKALLAAAAGATGIIFVNTKKRLFDAIGSADAITIPVVAVAMSAREKLTDGAQLILNLDSVFALGSAAELERKTLAAATSLRVIPGKTPRDPAHCVASNANRVPVSSTMSVHTSSTMSLPPLLAAQMQRLGSDDDGPLAGSSLLGS